MLLKDLEKVASLTTLAYRFTVEVCLMWSHGFPVLLLCACNCYMYMSVNSAFFEVFVDDCVSAIVLHLT